MLSDVMRSSVPGRPTQRPSSSPQPDWFGPEFDRADRGHRTAILVCVPIAIVAITSVAGGLTWTLWPKPRPAALVIAAPPPTPTPTGDPPAASAAPAPTQIPEEGAGTFSTAKGGTHRVGQGGKLVRYSVRVEKGIGQDAAAFAQAVDAIIAAPHGWTMAGTWSFQRVASGPSDFVITLASPQTSTKLCALGGMQTGGEVNCSAPGDVVINLKRWVLLTPYYQGRPDLYRALAINHEVGHRLGFGHMACPGKGKPAPVMMQQIFGLHGCVINAWPYDPHAHLITGSAVP